MANYTKKVNKLTYYKGRIYQKDETITFDPEDEAVARDYYGATQAPVPSTPDDLPNSAPAKAPRPAGKSVNNNAVTEKIPKTQLVDGKGVPIVPVVIADPVGEAQGNSDNNATM